MIMVFCRGRIMYRKEGMLVERSGRLEEINSHFDAVERLPLFMEKWAIKTAEKFGAKNVITATINPFIGCPLSGFLCGRYCYADNSIRNLIIKENFGKAYKKDMKKINGNVSLFVSSDTEAVPKNGNARKASEELFKSILYVPPSGLIVHSHTDQLATEPFLDILSELSSKIPVLAAITIETDIEDFQHNTPVENRIAALEVLSENGIKTQASLSPMLNFNDFEGFIQKLKDAGVYRVLVDKLRSDFKEGGSSKADKTLKKNYSLSEAIKTIKEEKFPGGVDTRENIFCLLPINNI